MLTTESATYVEIETLIFLFLLKLSAIGLETSAVLLSENFSSILAQDDIVSKLRVKLDAL